MHGISRKIIQWKSFKEKRELWEKSPSVMGSNPTPDAFSAHLLPIFDSRDGLFSGKWGDYKFCECSHLCLSIFLSALYSLSINSRVGRMLWSFP